MDEGSPDGDSDGIANCVDNCPEDSNADQANADGDNLGDVCEICGNSIYDGLDDDDDDIPNGCDPYCTNPATVQIQTGNDSIVCR